MERFGNAQIGKAAVFSAGSGLGKTSVDVQVMGCTRNRKGISPGCSLPEKKGRLDRIDFEKFRGCFSKYSE
jgi:hypothetical protein